MTNRSALGRILPPASARLFRNFRRLSRLSRASEYSIFKGTRAFVGAAMVALSLWVTGASAFAQQGDVRLGENEQLFCVLAAINAAGYKSGLSAEPMEAPRRDLRAALAKKTIPVLPQLERFYELHRYPDNSGKDLGQFVSLALWLGPAPDFKLKVPLEDLPPDARDVSELIPLLRQFYRQARLGSLWQSAQPQYQRRLAQASGQVRQAIEDTDGFLRFPSGAYLGRTMTIVLDLLGAPDQVQARIYGDRYIVVLTPAETLNKNAVRFEYMHFLLDPLASKFYDDIERSSALESMARKAPLLGRDFKSDYPLLVTECLIHAAEIHMDGLTGSNAQTKVQTDAEQGFILTPYFYGALGKFERGHDSMDVAYLPMMLAINPKKEAARLANVKYTLPTAPGASHPEISPIDRELDAGDNAIYAGRYDDALTAFAKVLLQDKTNQRALFGTAVAESNLRKPDLAIRDFKTTLARASDLWIVTWSHIYLGRIYDLMDERIQALAQYRAAALTASAYPDAHRAVVSGLKLPYGAM